MWVNLCVVIFFITWVCLQVVTKERLSSTYPSLNTIPFISPSLNNYPKHIIITHKITYLPKKKSRKNLKKYNLYLASAHYFWSWVESFFLKPEESHQYHQPQCSFVDNKVKRISGSTAHNEINPPIMKPIFLITKAIKFHSTLSYDFLISSLRVRKPLLLLP